MQITSQQHSSRRHQHEQQFHRGRNSENNNDIDGTAYRVASVTLESDSLSADAPMSFRSKRRKKVPRREKQQEMDTDDKLGNEDLKQSSLEGEEGTRKEVNPTYKIQMEWEESTAQSNTSTRAVCASDFENNQSDVLSDDSVSTSNADADDEQSDWPEFGELRQVRSIRITHGNLLLAEPTLGDVALSSSVIRQVEGFLTDPNEKELHLDQVYRTSAIKQLLRQKSVPIHIVKKGRGTVALKKI